VERVHAVASRDAEDRACRQRLPAIDERARDRRALVAITYRSAVDDPDWFGKSRLCGATPVAFPPHPEDTRTNIVFRNPTLMDKFVLEFQKPM
jgi:hypothetical protein